MIKFRDGGSYVVNVLEKDFDGTHLTIATFDRVSTACKYIVLLLDEKLNEFAKKYRHWEHGDWYKNRMEELKAERWHYNQYAGNYSGQWDSEFNSHKIHYFLRYGIQVVSVNTEVWYEEEDDVYWR